MSLSTEIWLIIAGICVGMAAVYLVVWFKSRQELANLFFSVSSLAAAWMALIELNMMHTQTAAESGELLGWYSVAVSIAVIGLVWFVRSYLKAGNSWLAWLITGIRTFSIVINFLPDRANSLYLEMDVPRQIMMWGETLWVPSGLVKSSWWHLNNTSSVLFLLYLAGALITTWRRGERRRVMVLGGSLSLLAFFLGLTTSILIYTSALTLPYALSMFFLIIVIAMVYELSTDLARSAMLAHRLQQSEQRMGLAVNAANLVLWEWNIRKDEIWTMNTIRGQPGTLSPDRTSLEQYLETVHPDDREQTRQAIFRTLESGEEFQACRAGLRLDVPDNLPKVRGDRIHLQQVVINLLLNSLDALKQAETEPRQIIIRASQTTDTMVELAVIDNGSGFPPDQLPHLFEPFFTTKMQGTGIGLAISRTIVEMHGGTIMAENNAENGATVRFTLPVASQGAVA